eukprot:COSAG06_NODE_46_length_29282_cov_16.235770_6_plen_75_part_00
MLANLKVAIIPIVTTLPLQAHWLRATTEGAAGRRFGRDPEAVKVPGHVVFACLPQYNRPAQRHSAPTGKPGAPA